MTNKQSDMGDAECPCCGAFVQARGGYLRPGAGVDGLVYEPPTHRNGDMYLCECGSELECVVYKAGDVAMRLMKVYK